MTTADYRARIAQLEAQLTAAQWELQQARERTKALEGTLSDIASRSECWYWQLRGWLDTQPDLSEWVHGDDGPAYPFLQLAKRAEYALRPSTAIPRAGAAEAQDATEGIRVGGSPRAGEGAKERI